MPTGLERELEVAIRLAQEAGALALRLFGTGLEVDRKSGNEPVTRADREANTLIVDGLAAAFPADGMLSEEAPDDGSRRSAVRVWMVDPIDGTKDFIRGESGFATMIGLIDGARAVLGVVYQPVGDCLYYAARQAGAWMKTGGGAAERLHSSAISDLSQLRMVASKSHRTPQIDDVRRELQISDEINVSSVGLKLGLIARGERDLYVNPSGYSKLWDVCGPEVILEEAGGKLTDLSGKPIDYRRDELWNLHGLIASNSHVHAEVVERLRALFFGPLS